MRRKLKEKKIREKKPKGIFVWKPEEAKEKMLRQISPSSCGSAALTMALDSLHYTFSQKEVDKAAGTRQRKKGTFYIYLDSRRKAGTNPYDLIKAAEKLTKGRIKGAFFPINKKTKVNPKWLKKLIEKDARIIATFNNPTIKEGYKGWHHAFVFGIDKHDRAHLADPSGVSGGLLSIKLKHLNAATGEKRNLRITKKELRENISKQEWEEHKDKIDWKQFNSRREQKDYITEHEAYTEIPWSGEGGYTILAWKGSQAGKELEKMAERNLLPERKILKAWIPPWLKKGGYKDKTRRVLRRHSETPKKKS